MTLEEKIYKDYVDALKAKNRARSDFLSFIRAELKNNAIAARKDKLEDDEAMNALKKQKKRLEETKEMIAQSGKADMIEATNREIAILDEYLPKQLGDDELTVIIEQIMKEQGASSIKDMGRVMKEVIAKVGAQADSKKISDIVKRKLSVS